MLRILEHPTGIPRPISMILAYPALDFNFTSWMSPTNLRVLRTEQSETQIPGLVHGKDHMRHKSPLSVVDDVHVKKTSRIRQKSWGETIAGKVPGMTKLPSDERRSLLEVGSKSGPTSPAVGWTKALPRTMSLKVAGWLGVEGQSKEDGAEADAESDGSDSGSDDGKVDKLKVPDFRKDADKALRERVKTPREERKFELTPVLGEAELVAADTRGGELKIVKKRKKAPIGTRLTMTSRVGYFQDRIISPSMVCYLWTVVSSVDV
jgi:hypothetical protein